MKRVIIPDYCVSINFRLYHVIIHDLRIKMSCLSIKLGKYWGFYAAMSDKHILKENDDVVNWHLHEQQVPWHLRPSHLVFFFRKTSP